MLNFSPAPELSQVSASLDVCIRKTRHAFHDFRRAGIEGQGRREYNAHRFFGAVGQNDVVADAFAVKVDVGLGGDGNVIKFFGGHG
jgi:hypothetical protein